MQRFEAEWTNGSIKFPVHFEVKEGGAIGELHPEGLRTKLYGAAYLAYVNFRNRLGRTLQDQPIMQIPTSITVIRQYAENEPFPRHDTGNHRGVESEGLSSLPSEPAS